MKIRNFFLIVSLLGLFAQSPLPAQGPTEAVTSAISATQEVWRNYTNTNQIHALTIQGDNLWAGTGGGVVRWDTITGSYTKFTTIDGLADNWVLAIASDKAGNVWVGTNAGVSKFDGAAWANYLAGIYVTAIASDAMGNVWFGTQFHGVRKFDGTAWTTYTSANGLADEHIYAIASDPAGNMWFGTIDGCFKGCDGFGVSKFDGSSWTSYTTADGLVSNRVNAIASDLDGNLWFGSDLGVSELYFIRRVSANYPGGASGSYFNLSGEHFPASQSAPVSVNGAQLGNIPISSHGTFTFTLSTTNANPGLYIVKVGESPSILLLLKLDAQGPLRPKEGDYNTFDIPSEIALTPRFYLPVLH
jgi:ligand-binding sensor domain-containing protein